MNDRRRSPNNGLPLTGMLTICLAILTAGAPAHGTEWCADVNTLLRRGVDPIDLADVTGLSLDEIVTCAELAARPRVVVPMGRSRRQSATGPAPFNAAGPTPFGAVGPVPRGAVGPVPRGATGPTPFGASGPTPFGAAGPPPRAMR